MAAEDLQSFFAETNEILENQPLTLQLKPEHYISPLVVMLPQNMKYPFNDRLYIRHYDPIKQYYTVEATSHPGRPIIAAIEAF